jgi:hypothetical protein
VGGFEPAGRRRRDGPALRGVSGADSVESAARDHDGRGWKRLVHRTARQRRSAGSQPAGVITEFPISEAGSHPASPDAITLGPDGNVWWADFISIGKITPAGTITRYFDLPSPSLTGKGITAGPDGNVWFTLNGSVNSIGRIKPNGDMDDFPVEDTIQLQDITLGPDGNLWFTDPLGKQVGKMTTTGTVTRYPTPMEVTSPQYIAAGPDGRLWFTSAIPYRPRHDFGFVHDVSRSGRRLPAGDHGRADGNMWFVEAIANNVLAHHDDRRDQPTSDLRPSLPGRSTSRWARTARSGSPRVAETRSAGQRPRATTP